MSRQLDILALEPYFGGARRNMLETLVRCSRHRWTLLTLPPRRMERRLAAAAHWFAEQIARSDVGPIDVLFTCDAINLGDLYQLCPAVVDHPSVVYFHCHQLPDLSKANNDVCHDLTNLTTATAATEIWFNSRHHVQAFMDGVQALVKVHPELQSYDPLSELQGKVKHVPPPVDLVLASETGDELPIACEPSTIFVDTRDADVPLLNAALEILYDLQNEIHLLVTGPAAGLSARFPIKVIAEHSVTAQVRGLLSARAYVSTKISALFDEMAVRALLLMRGPVLPNVGFYRELLPRHLHAGCLYHYSAEGLASGIHAALVRPPKFQAQDVASQLHPFDAMTACADIDDRLDQLAEGHRSGEGRQPKEKPKVSLHRRPVSNA